MPETRLRQLWRHRRQARLDASLACRRLTRPCASSVADADSLLRAQSGKQIRLRIYPSGDRVNARDVITTPLSSGRAWDLRYDDWEYSRRPAAEKLGGGALGYVHLRAMGSGDIAQW